MTANLFEKSTVEATQEDQLAIRSVEHMLSQDVLRSDERPRLMGADGMTIDLPEPLFQVLRQVVRILARGDDIFIVPVHKQLTTQQAADFLNVSRPHLISLLEKGDIEYSRTGKHRRIEYGKLMAYKRKRDAERREELAELTRLSEHFRSYD